MIDEARILEYSGPLLALLKWASMMKQFILYTIFLQCIPAALGNVSARHGAWAIRLCRHACYSSFFWWRWPLSLWRLCSHVFASTAIRSLWPQDFFLRCLQLFQSVVMRRIRCFWHT